MPNTVAGNPFEWFASFAQLFTCLVTTLILLEIYKRGYTVKSERSDASESKTKRDSGFLLLAGATAVWSAVGLVLVLKVYNVISSAQPGNPPQTAEILWTLLSIVNTVFLLGGAIHLDAFDLSARKEVDLPPRFLRKILAVLARRLGFWMAVSIAAIFMIVNLLQPRGTSAGASAGMIAYKIPDTCTSICVIALLMYGLFVSFQRRDFPALAWTALFALGIQVVAQIVDLGVFVPATPFVEACHWQLILSSKVMVCSLFIALAFSWIHKKREDAVEGGAAAPPSPEAPTITVIGPSSVGSGIFFRIVHTDRRVDLTREKLFLRILEMIAKSYERGQENRWVDKSELDGDANADFSHIRTATDPLFEVDENRGKRRLRAEHRLVHLDLNALQRHDWSTENNPFWLRIRPTLVEKFSPGASGASTSAS